MEAEAVRSPTGDSRNDHQGRTVDQITQEARPGKRACHTTSLWSQEYHGENTDRSDNTDVPDIEHNVIVTIHSSNNVKDTDVDYNTSNSNSDVDCSSNINSNIDVNCSSNSDTDVNISFFCPNDQSSHN